MIFYLFAPTCGDISITFSYIKTALFVCIGTSSYSEYSAFARPNIKLLFEIECKHYSDNIWLQRNCLSFTLPWIHLNLDLTPKWTLWTWCAKSSNKASKAVRKLDLQVHSHIQHSYQPSHSLPQRQHRLSTLSPSSIPESSFIFF